jgi:geranylgeranylglycerol-phosphate geranylgeranyltransferase
VALARLVRWPNALLAAAGVLVGARGAGLWWSPAVLAAALAAIFLAVVANAFNDYDDREIDAVIHPQRPLPSGAISINAALRAVVIAAAGGIILSVLARPAIGALSVGVIVVMLAYGRVKAEWGVAANAIVAILGSMPFLYGAWAAGNAMPGVVLVGLAAPLHFAREIDKDVDDMAGDLGRRRTLPIVAGVGVARTVSVAATAAFVVAWIAFMHARWIAMPAVLLAVAGAYWGAPAIYKAAMAAAMIAYYVSRP